MEDAIIIKNKIEKDDLTDDPSLRFYETGANHWLVPFFFILSMFGLCYCCVAKKKTHYKYYGGLDNYNNNFREIDRKIINF